MAFRSDENCNLIKPDNDMNHTFEINLNVKDFLNLPKSVQTQVHLTNCPKPVSWKMEIIFYQGVHRDDMLFMNIPFRRSDRQGFPIEAKVQFVFMNIQGVRLASLEFTMQVDSTVQNLTPPITAKGVPLHRFSSLPCKELHLNIRVAIRGCCFLCYVVRKKF
ncbi:hypothetical protein CDAR_174891 [Caerostris darwini]|uniref:Uncharacterized protein n=1 Tax=Caerostris darwini TaxID=1538125 RepID=A0AAV4X626_9ARAC|nr:hypothetical protein CDAR_174891 [Caerostris darwini]